MPKPITPFLAILVPSAMTIIIFYFNAHLFTLVDVLFILLLGFVITGAPLLVLGIKIIPEYKRAIVFRKGRMVGVFGPGIIMVDPILDRVYLVDMRAKTLLHELKDVSMLDTTVRCIMIKIVYRVINPSKALAIVHYEKKLLKETESIVRKELSQVSLDEFISEKSIISKKILSKLNKAFTDRGIEILNLELEKTSGDLKPLI